MHSKLEQIVITAQRLPKDLRVIFEDCIMNDKPMEKVCAEQSISPEEFQARQTRLLREMRALANTGVQTP